MFFLLKKKENGCKCACVTVCVWGRNKLGGVGVGTRRSGTIESASVEPNGPVVGVTFGSICAQVAPFVHSWEVVCWSVFAPMQIVFDPLLSVHAHMQLYGLFFFSF